MPLSKKKHRVQGYPFYLANRENDKFIFYKKLNTLSLIYESGLLSYLHDTCMPGAIVLFGSAAKGEDTKSSDADVFLLCKERKLELEKYEKRIGRNINIFIV